MRKEKSSVSAEQGRREERKEASATNLDWRLAGLGIEEGIGRHGSEGSRSSPCVAW
jgi:hypothetical protein